MRQHVCALCGQWSLLFPAENIAFISPVAGHLGVPERTPAEERVTLRWRSTDGAREALLLVDGVDEIVNCYAGDLIQVAILPRRLRPLCDQVMRAPGGRLRLQVKPDVRLPLEQPAARRRFALSRLAELPLAEAAAARVVRP
jgi:hypothetical protein